MARFFLEDFNDYKDFAFLKLAGTNSQISGFKIT